MYGFYDECLRKYGSVNVWRYCTDIFDYLSLSALVDNRILCVHGGLSPTITTVDQIRTIDRKQEVPHDGAMCDLLWSDPEDVQGWGLSPRGAGYLFGDDVCKQFNENNKIELIARAHQLVMEGYKWMFDEQLVTVWSARQLLLSVWESSPAILELDENLQKNFKVFEAAPQEEGECPRRKPPPIIFCDRTAVEDVTKPSSTIDSDGNTSAIDSDGTRPRSDGTRPRSTDETRPRSTSDGTRSLTVSP